MADDTKTEKTTGSILTPSQRAFLRGESDIEPGSSYARSVRSRIRDRIRAAMSDFSLLLNSTDHGNLESALRVPEHTDAHLDGVSAGLIDGTAFMLAANVAAYPANDVTDGESYRNLTAEAIRRACRHSGIGVSRVDVEIDIETAGELSDVADEDLAALSISTLRQLLFAGEVSEEKFDRAIETKIENK